MQGCSLIETFGKTKATRLQKKINFIYTLKQGMHNRSNKTEIKNNNGNIFGGEEALNILPGKNKSDNYRKRVITSSGSTSTKVITGMSNASFYSKNNIATSNEKTKNYLIIEKTDNHNNYFSPVQNFKENPGKELTENLKKNNNEVISEQAIIGDGKLKDHLKEDDNSAIIKNNRKETPIVLRKKKGVYIGLVAGFDFSKVQSMSFNNPGFDAGLIFGFRVNGKLSFEAGMLLNKKNYSSEDKNFRMDKVRSTMAPDMIINKLESQCSLVEIPIKAKYDFISKRNSDLFVGVGVSSYIMTKEKNIYNVSLNGNQEKIKGVYEKNNYGLPAVANISIGYEHSVSEYLEIRIEPFLKIPLQGMGVGNLPLTSAGLQVGITSRLN